MHLPRISWPPLRSFTVRDGALRGFLRRLNVRLVVAIATVSLVGLIVSGVAINQIVPGYFRQQAVARLQTATLSIILLAQEYADLERETRPGVLAAPELRDSLVFGRAARVAAGPVIPATVEIYNERGQLAARAEPPNPDKLTEEGLQRDPDLPAYATGPINLRIAGDGTTIAYRIVLRDAYTSRETTMQQIRSALLGAGILALAVSLLAGMLVARRLTVPINRLRRVALQVARGNLDERAQLSGVLEIDELAAARVRGRRQPRAADADRRAAHVQRPATRWQGRYGDPGRVPVALAGADQPARVAEHEPARPIAHRCGHLPPRHGLGRPARPDPLGG